MSTPREIIVTCPHPSLFPHDRYCLGVDGKPSCLLSWGTHASPPWGSCSRSSLTPAHEVRFSPLPRTGFAPRLAFCAVGKLHASFTVGDMASGLSVEVGFGSAGLVPQMGKALVSNITVPLGFAVVRKDLAMARLSIVASPLAILPPPPSRFRPLAPYCPISWHLTANYPPPAVTLLLPTGWHSTATQRLAPYSYSLAGTLLLLL